MIVVPDAGPLIRLASAGQLELLRRLYQRVIVPRAVHDEVVIAAKGLIGSVEVAAATWIEIDDEPPDLQLLTMLDRGEAAAIPLAQRLNAILLCDDIAGRQEARRRSLPVVGTLGVLLSAKRTGLLDSVKPVLDAMRAKGMHVSEELVRTILAAAGEFEGRQ